MDKISFDKTNSKDSLLLAKVGNKALLYACSYSNRIVLYTATLEGNELDVVGEIKRRNVKSLKGV